MFYQDFNEYIFLSFVLFELKYNTMILFVLVKLLSNYSLIDRNRFNFRCVNCLTVKFGIKYVDIG